MNQLTSKDGTKIAYDKLGSGQPLVIVGGSLSDHNFYLPLAEELAKKFTVYNFDRRGRGESGDTQPYSVEREVEDIAAIIEETNGPVALYGHSAGSALTIRAAAANLRIARLILADPPFTTHGDNDNEAVAQYQAEYEKVRELHDKGDHRGNAFLFLCGFGMPEQEVNDLLDSPVGESMIACAKALPYDYAVLGDGLVPGKIASKITVPTSILASGYSVEAAQELADIISEADLSILPASTHEMSPIQLAETISKAAG
jgi:pimeloyl-ACP methyl ester carboxylesterase